MTMTRNKTLLFASTIFVLAFSLSNVNMAFAEDLPKEINELAQKGAKIAERIQQLEATPQTEAAKKEIKQLTAELDRITAIVNEYGLMTLEQFEESQKNPEPVEIPEFTTESCCDPVVIFRSGFDYRLYGWWYGTTYGDWKLLATPTTSAVSVAYASTWQDYDYGTPFTQAYVDPAGTSADLYISSTVWNNGNLVKSYTQHTETVTSTSPIKYYEPSSVVPGKAGDEYHVLGYLISIS